MRKIEKELREAIQNQRTFSKQNTVFTHDPNFDLWILYLHGNAIAQFKPGNTVPDSISLAGWPTTTTKSRLNALDGVVIHTKDFTPYLNGKEILEYGWYKLNGERME